MKCEMDCDNEAGDFIAVVGYGPTAVQEGEAGSELHICADHAEDVRLINTDPDAFYAKHPNCDIWIEPPTLKVTCDAMDESSERVVIQVVMLNKLRPHFEAWLRSIGMNLAPMPGAADIAPPKPDDLPTYIVIPDLEQTAELMARRDELLRQLDDS